MSAAARPVLRVARVKTTDPCAVGAAAAMVEGTEPAISPFSPLHPSIAAAEGPYRMAGLWLSEERVELRERADGVARGREKLAFEAVEVPSRQ